MNIRHTILSKITRFLRAYDVKRSHFGTLAVGDRAFIRQLETGQPVTLGRIERAEAFMANYAAAHGTPPLKKKKQPARLAPKRKRA